MSRFKDENKRDTNQAGNDKLFNRKFDYNTVNLKTIFKIDYLNISDCNWKTRRCKYGNVLDAKNDTSFRRRLNKKIIHARIHQNLTKSYF